MSHPSITQDFDAIIIGGGISGMFMVHRLRSLGMKVRAFENGSDVGGTWYWNRYPGARFDSESWTYGYTFSEELLQEWDWTENYSPQPHTLKYVSCCVFNDSLLQAGGHAVIVTEFIFT